MRSIAQRRGVRQFVKFGLVGASGFLVNLIIFTILQRFVPNHDQPVPYYIIFSISYILSGISNYYLNRIWTFRSSGHAIREGAQFLSVSAISLVAGLIVSAIVGKFLGHGHYGHTTWFIATVAGMFVNFFLNKYWTFKHAA
ncbi:MAG TPA: GtrA family protein [Candidatus Baltobacteraceae bacterium]|nr:GtrA family protein [Candidatus Baltobacteraceae bacterium]